MRLIDADTLYNGAMKEEYFKYVESDNHGKESFAYSCAMQRLAEAPTMDAIPVEWLRKWQDEVGTLNEWWPIIERIITVWQKEQEARNSGLTMETF